MVILGLAAFAGIAYYLGTPPNAPSVQYTAAVCPPLAPLVVIPQDVAINSSANFQPPTLTVVVGFNNTVGWDDQDTSGLHVVSSVSEPPYSIQWDLNMTAGQSYCVTLTNPGTYSYEIRLPAVVVGMIVVKTAE